MARKYIDCREFPTGKACTVSISGTEDEVLDLAIAHAIVSHGHDDPYKLRKQLKPMLKDMPEVIYVAVSVSNQCGYCIASHTAAARKGGMTDAMFHELMAVVGMANESNRLASGYQVPIDSQFQSK